jgi:GNAT superfamily N-acetyltransferase
MTAAVRRARISDATDIARLTTDLGYEPAPPDVASRLSRILERADQDFFLAETDGRPVGWIHVAVLESVESEPFAMIAGLVVDRDHRRAGVGRLLTARAEEWAAAQGCSLVRLWSSAGRTAAHTFYEQLGYANIKTQYAFVKPLNDAARQRLRSLVPRIDEQ